MPLEGEYEPSPEQWVGDQVALYESSGGSKGNVSHDIGPRHPAWYFNVKADPHIELQDGPVKQDMWAREVTGAEKVRWWERAVAAYPPYAEYQRSTQREIPVFVLEPATSISR